jgi:putative phage-type endonuclease
MLIIYIINMEQINIFVKDYIIHNSYEDSIYENIENMEHLSSLKMNITASITKIYDFSENFEIYMLTNVVDYVIDDMIKKYINIERLKSQMNRLQALELPEQRSKEWYELRKGMLTASSLACALGDDHFKSRNQLILEKVENKEIPFVPNPITEWGVKYEEIATKFYESMNDLKIIEFGLIPHHNFTIFGASPDGICSNDSPNEYVGRMLEIKCPPKRKFTKTVPKHYWYQMQGQLECCDLEECDFLQVKLQEYNNFEDYSNDISNDTFSNGKTLKGFPKGCTLTYRKMNELKCSYLYPELFLTNDEYQNWISENRAKIESEGHEFVEAKWWYIERYECTLVKRDREWWIQTMEKIYLFNKEVKYYKQNGVEELKHKINGNKPFDISTIEECLL